MQRFRAEQASIGSNSTVAQTAALRLGALGGATPPWQRIVVDVNGDIGAQVLQASEIPSEFTRRDVAETIAQPWTWGAGHVIAFTSGTLAPPQLSTRSVGTRLVIEPVAASTEYALGRDTDALWASVPTGKDHRWYTSNIERLRLTATGALEVVNGAGQLLLANSADGSGSVRANGTLYVRAQGTGALQLASGTGDIWPVTPYRENLGSVSRKFLSLHAAELWTETLVAQETIATIGGSVLIGPTTTLTRDLAPADTSIYVKHNSFGLYVGGVEYGSKLVLKGAGKFEAMQIVTSVTPTAEPAGDYRYVVERNIDGTGADQWYAGDAVVDTGKVTVGPGGFIDQYSLTGLTAGSSEGPTIVGNVRTGHPWSDWRPHWAIGNLKGLYGYTTRTYGACFGDPNTVHMQIDATNGIRMLGAGGTSGFVYGQWDVSGNMALGYGTAGQLRFTASSGRLQLLYAGTEKMAVASDGLMYLSSGLVCGGLAGTTAVVRSANAGAWNSGFGFCLHSVYDTGVTSVLIGNSTGRRLQWTDTGSLKIVSDGFTLDENGIFLDVGSSANSRTIRFGSNNTILWDAGAGLNFSISKFNGHIGLAALEGVVSLQGGTGGGSVASVLQVQNTGISCSMPSATSLRSTVDNYNDLGTTSLRWRFLHSVFVKSLYGAFAGANSNLYYVEVSQDSAAKPTSSTWTIPTSSRATKHAIAAVDTTDALARVRRVPVVRYRTNDGDHPAIGVIAEDVRDTLPLSVRDHGEGRLDWNAHELFMLNVAAVQALATRLDRLEKKGKARR